MTGANHGDYPRRRPAPRPPADHGLVPSRDVPPAIGRELDGLREYVSPRPLEPRAATLRQLVHSIFGGKVLLLVTTTIGLFGGAFFALSQPNSYRSEARLVVLGGHEGLMPELLLLNGDNARQGGGVGMRESAAAMLSDDELHRRVVERVGASTILAPFKPYFDPSRKNTFTGRIEWLRFNLQTWLLPASKPRNDPIAAIKVFKRSFEPDPDRQGYIYLSYSANSPSRAQEVLQAVVHEFKAHHALYYSDTSMIALIKRCHEDALRKFENASQELEKFKKEGGIQNYELQVTQAEKQVTDYALELSGLEYEVGRAQRQLASLEGDIAKAPEVVEQVQTETIPNPVLVANQEELVRLTQEEAKQKRVLREGDPALTRLQQSIREMERQIDADRSKPPQTRRITTVVPNAERIRLIARRDDARMAAEERTNRLANVQEVLQGTRTELRRLAGLAPEHQRVITQARNASDTLAVAARSLSVAEKAAELGREGVSSLKFPLEPTLPLDKDKPDRGRMLLGGLVGGLFAGIAILLLRGILDPTVRGPEDLEETIGLRVLATIPELQPANVRRHRRLRVIHWS